MDQLTICELNNSPYFLIWGGKAHQKKFHLTRMEKIATPRSLGGWGLLDMRTFGKALLCRSLWRGIFGDGLWSNTIKNKYMKGRDIKHWYKKGRIGSKYGSAIWLSFWKIEHYFLKNLKWKFQMGSIIFIGIDPFVGGREAISIPKQLLCFFHRIGIFTWDKLISACHGPIPIWKEAYNLDMPAPMADLWNSTISYLKGYGFHRSGTTDYLVWSAPNTNLAVQVKDIYSNLISLKALSCNSIFPLLLWKLGCPPKSIFFSWLVFYNKNLTWENLRKRNWHGPSNCAMCDSHEESNFHMFFQCQSMLQIWQVLANIFGYPLTAFSSSQAAFEWWSTQKESWRPLIIIVLWCAWKW